MKAALYARYSSDKQTEQSIEGQVRVVEAYCAHHNIEIVSRYYDRATSASKDVDARHEFQRMVSDSVHGRWDAVVVYKLDRFARNRYDSATYKAKLKKHGVRVISATENISENPEGVILESVLEGMAEYFSAELSQKVRRGMKESALKANSTGGSIPLGYRLNGKKLEIDPAYEWVAKEIFKLKAAGWSNRNICDKINGLGYRTKKGKPFVPKSFSAIFANPKYIGTYDYNGEVVIEGAVPQLVDRETFEAVQESLRRNQRAPGRGKAKVEYLLSGKLFCGHCGRPMTGESTTRRGVGHHYYACSGKKRFHDCSKKNIRKDDIERIVVEDTIKHILTEENMQLIAAKAVRKLKESSDDTKLTALENCVREADKGIANILVAIEQGAISQALTARLNALEEQKKDAQAALEEEQNKRPELTESQVYYWLLSFVGGHVDDPDFRRSIIEMLVSRIYVYDDPEGYRLRIDYSLTGTEPGELKHSDVGPPGTPKEPNPNISFPLAGICTLTIKHLTM